jgi:PleD family two-component response regulator
MGKGTILVVDDDENIRSMLSVYFGGQEYVVFTCTNYDDAIEMARKQLPSVIVTELDLPDRSGWDLIRDIRETIRTSHIPIVVISKGLSEDDKRKFRDAIVDDYAAKPLDIEELKLRIQNATQSRRRPKQINPASGFPTGQLIENHLRVLMRKNIDWAYFDIKIANFDAFKELRGWKAGDEVIKAMALAITDVLEQYGTNDDFAGHPGGDYFVIITMNKDWMMAMEMLKLRAASFLSSQYSEEERQRGYVVINERKNPLMQLIYGVFVAKEHPRDIDVRDVVNIASEDRRKNFGDEPKLDDGVGTEG